jgi:rhodanese-related sulfurtransferase
MMKRNCKKTWLIFFSMSVLSVLFYSQKPCAAIDSLSHDSLSSLMEHGTPYNFILIDLRGPADNFSEVIGNALCHPYNLVWPDTFLARCEIIPKTSHIIIYCQSGTRAGRAIAHLHNAGGFSSGMFSSWAGSKLSKSLVIPNDSLPDYSMVASSTNIKSAEYFMHKKNVVMSNRLVINQIPTFRIIATNHAKAFTLKGQRLLPAFSKSSK